MGQNKKKNSSLFIAILVIFFALSLVCLYHYQHSVFLHNERVSIGVMAKKPFVFSYNKEKDLAYIAYFNPEVLVNLSGGYSWYKLGSVNLLGKIEKKRSQIIKAVFSELIGAPIDIVIYEKQAKVFDQEQADFLEYFYDLRSKNLFSTNYLTSTKNFFDKILLKKILKLRADHLIVLNAETNYEIRKGKKYYTAEKLDLNLRGYFYETPLNTMSARIKLFTTAAYYNNANQRIRRIIEGTGIKVFDTEIIKKWPQKQCLIVSSPKFAKTVKRLQSYFNCQLKTDSQTKYIINFYLGPTLAEMYF